MTELLVAVHRRCLLLGSRDPRNNFINCLVVYSKSNGIGGGLRQPALPCPAPDQVLGVSEEVVFGVLGVVAICLPCAACTVSMPWPPARRGLPTSFAEVPAVSNQISPQQVSLIDVASPTPYYDHIGHLPTISDQIPETRLREQLRRCFRAASGRRPSLLRRRRATRWVSRASERDLSMLLTCAE